MTGFLQRWTEQEPIDEVVRETPETESRSLIAPGNPGTSSLAATSPALAVPDRCISGLRAGGLPLSDGDSERTQSDPTVANALLDISGLLAKGYRRYAAIRRVAQDRSPKSGNYELANSSSSSVHGVVL